MQDFENGNLNIPPSFGEGVGMNPEFDFQAPNPIDSLVPVNFDTSIPAIPTVSGIVDVGYDNNNPFEFFKKTQENGATPEEMAFQAAKPYSFASGYKQTNFDRYYNDSDNFYKLGFNPIANNEEVYNANRSWYQDLWRGASHIPHLGASFVKSGYRSLGDMFSGDFSFTDEQGANEFEEIMAKYGSTKGGVTGFTSNLVLQSGIIAGITADYIATEAALVGITALSEGIALPGAIAASTAKTAQLAKRIADLRKLASANTAREVYNTVRTAKVANIVDGGISMLSQGVKNLAPNTVTNISNLIKGNSQITDLAQVARGVGDFVKDVKQISYTTSESSLEGGMIKNEFIDKRVQEFINEKGYYPEEEDLNKIYQLAEDAGFTTGMINAPLIYLTNGITFDNLFKGGKTALVKSTDKLVTQSSKTGRKLIINPVTGEAKITAGLAENTKLALKGFTKPKEYLDFTRRYFAANLAEGIQETSQEIIGGASTDYFERLYRTPEAGGVNLYLTDAFENLKAQASGQGVETFLSGFLMGGLAGISGAAMSGAKVATIQKYYEKKDPAEYKQLFDEETKRFNAIADELNEAIQKGNKILTPDFENLLVQIRAGADMVDALKSFDEKAFHDIKDAARFNSIYTALETGKFNFLQQKLEDMKQMNGAELKEAFELSDDVTEEEAKKVLDVAISRANQIKSQYEQFSEYKNPFNPNKYTLDKQFQTERIGYQGFEDARKIATFSLHNIDLVSKRLQDLSNNITEISNLGDIAFSDVLPLLSVTDLQTEIDILSQEIETSKGVTDPALKKQTENKSKKLKALEQFKKHFEKIESIEDKTELEKARWIKDAFVKYMNQLAENNNKTFIKADLEKAYTYFIDYLALNKDLGRFTEAVNSLTDPVGFYNEVNRRIKARKAFEEKRADFMKESFKEFLSDAKTNELINYLDDNNFIIDKATIPTDLPKGYEAFKTFLLTDPDVKFVDQKTQRTFSKSDPRFKEVERLILDFDNLTKEQAAKEEEARRKAEEEARKKNQEPPTKKSQSKKPITFKNVPYDELDVKVKEFAENSFAQLSDEQKGGATIQQYVDGNEQIQRLNAFMNAFKNLLSSTKSGSYVVMPISSTDSLIIKNKPDLILKYVTSEYFGQDPRVAKLVSDYGLELQDVVNIYKPVEIETSETTVGVPLPETVSFVDAQLSEDDLKLIINNPGLLNLINKLRFVELKNKAGASVGYTFLNKEGNAIMVIDKDTTQIRPIVEKDISTLLTDLRDKQTLLVTEPKKGKDVFTQDKKFKINDILEKRDTDNKPVTYQLANIEKDGTFLLIKLEKGRPVGNYFKVKTLDGFYLKGESPSSLELLPKASPNEVFTVYNSVWTKNPELKSEFESLLITTPKDELLSKIKFVVRKNKVTNPVLNYFVTNQEGVKNNRIAYQSEEYEIGVQINGVTVGYLRNPNSFKFYNEEGKEVTVNQMTSDLYNSIFFNNILKLDGFQKSFAAYSSFVNEIITKAAGKPESVIPYNSLTNTYASVGVGSYNYLTGGSTTNFNDLDYKYVNDNNGIYLIDRFENPETKTKVEQIITKNVTPEEAEEIRKEINKPINSENVSYYEDTTKALGRYVLVVKIPNGTYKFIELRPGKPDAKDATNLFNDIIKEANRIKKDNVIYDEDGKPADIKQAGANLSINNRIKDELFFALNKTKDGGIDFKLEVTDQGNLQFSYAESFMKGANGKDFKIVIYDEVKSLDDLLTKVLEKALAHNLNPDNKLILKLPGLDLNVSGKFYKQSVKQKTITKANVNKLKDAIRKGFPKNLTAANVTNVLPTMFTSVGSSVIKPGTINLNFSSSFNIQAPGINVQGDGKKNTSLRNNSSKKQVKKEGAQTSLTSDIPDNPATLEIAKVVSLRETIDERILKIQQSKAEELKGKTKSERTKILDQDPEYKKLVNLRQVYFQYLLNNAANKDSQSWSKDDVDDLDQFISWLNANLPGGIITVDDTLNLNNKMLSGNVTVGQFYAHLENIDLGIEGIRGVIRTSKDAPFKYHEAFHSVFRLFLTDNEINYYLDQAKKEVYAKLKKEGRQLSSAIADMVATNPEFYNKMSRSQLEKRLFEEHLADRFQEYKKLNDTQQQTTNNYSGVKGFFYKLANLIKSVFNRYTKNSVDTLFNRINSAQFKSAPVQKNVFTQQALEYGITEPALKAIILKNQTDFQMDASGQIVKVVKYMASADVINLTSSIASTVLDRFENNNPDNLSLLKLLDKTLEDYTNLYDSDSDTSAYVNLDEGSIEAEKFLIYESVLENNTAELKESVRQHLSTIRKVKEITDENLADSIKELEFGLRGAEDFDKTAEEIGGFGNLPTYIKSFLATTTLRASDEFGNTELVEGEPLLQAIDAKAVYDSILSLTAGSVNEYDFYSRLRNLSSNNPHINAAVNRLFNEAGIILNDSDETVSLSNPSKANIAVLFYKSMGYLQSTPYVTMLKGRNNAIKIFNSNQKGAAQLQFSIWSNAFNSIFYTKFVNKPDERESLISKSNIALDTLKFYISENEVLNFDDKEILSDADIIDLTNQANVISKNIYDILGITLKPDYIVLSALENSKGFIASFELNKSSYTSDTQNYLKVLYTSSEDILESVITDEDINWLKSSLNAGKNPFIKVELSNTVTEEDEELEDDDQSDATTEFNSGAPLKTDIDNISRLYKIAKGSTKFDETVSTTTFSRENGDKIWNYQIPTFNRRILTKIKDLVLKNKDVKAEDLPDDLRYNPLFNNLEFKNLALSPQFITKRIGELKESTLDDKGNQNKKLESNKLSQAKAYKKFSPRDLMLFMIDNAINAVYYQNYQKEDGTPGVAFRAPVLTRILEASSTAEYIELPVIKTITQDNKASRGYVFNKDFTNSIAQEILRQLKRIEKTREEIRQIEEIGKDAYIKNGGEVIEGYHTGKKRGIDFSPSMKELLMMNGSTLYDTLLNETTTSEIFKDKNFALNLTGQIADYFESQVDDFLNVLESLGVIKANKKIYDNELLSDKITKVDDNINLREGNVRFNLAQVFLNDYYNTLFYNNLTIGDEAIGIKDAIDAFKRAKGMNAAFINIATTFTAPEYGINHKSDKSHILVFNEPTVRSTNASKKEIERADGQTYTTVKGLRYTLWGLGRLNKQVAAFLDDIEAGVPITSSKYFGSKNVAGMFDYDAKFNSLKLVYYDDKQNYIKTSVALLTKELTSNKTKDGWQAKPGREFLHNLRERLERFERETPETFAFASPASSIKMKKSNVFGENGDNLTETINTADNNYFTQLDNSYWGLQTENPGGKKKITDPSQIKVIVESELNEDVEVNYLGKDIPIKDLRNIYQLSSARKVELSYNKTINKLFDFGDVQHELGNSINENRITPKLEEFINYAKETLEASGGSSQLISMFSVDEETGQPKYNLNNIITEGKFIEFFFSYFRSVTNQKVKGDSLTLVSDLGFDVLREVVKIYPNGSIETRVVPQSEMSKFTNKLENKKTVTDAEEGNVQVGDVYFDRLRHNQKVYDGEGNITGTHAEVMVPPLSKDIMDYISANGFAPDVVTDFFATRIPSQDKHSSQNYKIVDFLPVFYSSSIVAPAEMVEVTGHDFDVDKLYSMFKEFYKKKVKGKTEFIEFGTATGKSDRFEEFLKSQFKTREFRLKFAEVEKKFEKQIDDEFESLFEMGYSEEEIYEMYDVDNLIDKEEVLKQTLIELNLPSTAEAYVKLAGENSSNIKKQIVPEILHNNIVNARRTFVSNNAVTVDTEIEGSNPISFDPANTQPFEDVIESFEKEFKDYPEFLELLDDKNFDVNSLTGKVTGFGNIMEGAEGIGPAVVMNTAFHFLNTHKVSIKNDNDKVFNLQINDKVIDSKTKKEKVISNIYRDFGTNKAGDIRKAYLLSAVVTAMTDNAKLIIASKFNLNPDAVGILSYMVALGVPFNKALKITSSNVIRDYYNALKNNNSAFKTQQEEKAAQQILEEKLKALKPENIENLILTSDDLNKGITEKDNKEVNYKLLFTWSELSKQATYATKLANIIRISQGLGKSFEDLDSLAQDITDLGLTLKGKDFVMSNETYDESSIPFVELREAIKTKAFEVKEYIKVVQEIDKLSGFLFIRRTSLFKKLFESVKLNFKVTRRFEDKFNENLNKDLLSYLTLKAFVTNEANKGAASSYSKYLNNALVYRQLESEQEEGFKNINAIINSLREKSPDNTFLNFLNNVPVITNVIQNKEVVTRRNLANRTNINYVETNTWASLTKPEIERLQLSIIDLYNDPNTRDEALGLLSYLMVKDGLQFKSGSFLSVMPPEVLDPYLKSVNKALDLLSIQNNLTDLDSLEKVFGIIFGASPVNLIKDFITNYSKHINNSFYIRSISQIDEKKWKDIGTVPAYYPGATGEGVIRVVDSQKTKGDREYITVDMFVGTAVKYERIKTSDEGIQYQEEITEFNKEKFKDNLNFVEESGFPLKSFDKKTVIGFPFVIKQKVEVGEEKRDIYYELVSVKTSLIDKGAPKDLTNYIGKGFGMAFGSGAVYRKTKQIGVKAATPLGFIFEGEIPTNESIRLDLKNLKEDIKETIEVLDLKKEEQPVVNNDEINATNAIQRLKTEFNIKQDMLTPGKYFDADGFVLVEFDGLFPEQVLSKLIKSGKSVKFEEQDSVVNSEAKEDNIKSIQNNPAESETADNSVNDFGFMGGFSMDDILDEDPDLEDFKNNCKGKKKK